MTTFDHEDARFELQPKGDAWALLRCAPDGSLHRIGTGLFAGVAPDEALRRARALACVAYPVGVRLVAPDLAHTGNADGLRLVPPDIAHPRFVNWTASRSSFAPGTDAGISTEEGHHGTAR